MENVILVIFLKNLKIMRIWYFCFSLMVCTLFWLRVGLIHFKSCGGCWDLTAPNSRLEDITVATNNVEFCAFVNLYFTIITQYFFPSALSRQQWLFCPLSVWTYHPTLSINITLVFWWKIKLQANVKTLCLMCVHECACTAVCVLVS